MAVPVSVLMSVYNGQRWLAESIQSVLSQSFTDFEFIIVNDGSEDGSLRIINQFAAKDSRIRAFDKVNTGLTDSLNYGLSLSRGEWVARIDADDLWEVSRLSKQMSLATSIKGVVLVGAGAQLVNEGGAVEEQYVYPTTHKKLVRNLISNQRFFAHSSAMFKAEKAREIGLYRARFIQSQDRDLWLRLSEVGNIVARSEALVFIRRHENQISNANNGKRQLIYSYIAMICFWVRRHGYKDPVESMSDSEFNEFYCWVEREMESAGVFGLNNYIIELKKKISSKDFGVIRLFIIVSLVVGSPRCSYLLLKSRVFGAVLPKMLATRLINHV